MSMVVLVGVVVGMVTTHKRTKRRRYILTMIGERYTAIHYALPMCQAIPTETNVVYKLHSSTHTWKTRQYQFCFGLSLYAINQRKLYIVGIK